MSFTNMYRERVENRMDELYAKCRDDISHGTCRSFDDYAARCAYLRAIRDIGVIMRDVAREIHEDYFKEVKEKNDNVSNS